MTPRENALAILDRKQPDAYFDFMEAVEIVPDPLLMAGMIPQDGKEHADLWGTVHIFKPGAPGSHPHITEQNKVIPDIEHWQERLSVPDTESMDWSFTKQYVAGVDRRKKLVCVMLSAGLFERSHFLMGMEDALCAYLEYPEEMAALLTEIKNHKVQYIRRMAAEIRPDVIFYHDDWGSKQNLFLPPRVWRSIIKPLQREIADTIHECGMLYMHHADCICEPIAEDMVEIGVDIWQGVIPQNDIVKIQRITGGRLAMVGGIDGPAIDVASATEEEIRAEVRRAVDTYCPAGRFFPSIPNGQCYLERNNAIAMDELKSYGRQWALEHPAAT